MVHDLPTDIHIPSFWLLSLKALLLHNWY